MKEPNSVSILGCGWLGFPLAEALLAQGYRIKGSTTTPDKCIKLKDAGIIPYLLNFTGGDLIHDLFSDFLKSDVLLIAVPPGRTAEKQLAYQQIFQILAEAIHSSPIKHLILISSTSVYGENNEDVDEDTVPVPTEPSGVWMRKMEQMAEGFNTPITIVRLAGLIGPERHPSRFFSGKTGLPNGLAPVNLIHQADAVNVLIDIIRNQPKGVINACAPSHPSRMEFYSFAAERAGLVSPHFHAKFDAWKLVKCQYLNSINFSFQYPDLMDLLLSDSNK